MNVQSALRPEGNPVRDRRVSSTGAAGLRPPSLSNAGRDRKPSPPSPSEPGIVRDRRASSTGRNPPAAGRPRPTRSLTLVRALGMPPPPLPPPFAAPPFATSPANGRERKTSVGHDVLQENANDSDIGRVKLASDQDDQQTVLEEATTQIKSLIYYCVFLVAFTFSSLQGRNDGNVYFMKQRIEDRLCHGVEHTAASAGGRGQNGIQVGAAAGSQPLCEPRACGV